MKCAECGSKMTKTYDGYFCNNCGSECDSDGDSWRMSGYEEDGKPEGCIACGNNAWPDCEDSCPMFD